MKTIKTNKGVEYLVDDDFYDELKNYTWWKHFRGYAVTLGKKGTRFEKRRMSMHRMIMELAGVVIPKGSMVDHINMNPRDNQIDNLRIVTHQENLWNSNNRRNKRSKYRGVSWSNTPRRVKRWRAVAKVNNKVHTIGHYATEEEAAKAYTDFIAGHPIRKRFMNHNYQLWQKEVVR